MTPRQFPLRTPQSRRPHRPRRVRRARPLARRLGWAALALVLVVAGGAWAYISYLDGNIRHGALSFGDQGAQSVDAFGHRPLNILLIGSDSRDSAEDVALGGARNTAGGPVHADVEMLLHVSADRSNASLISIPRDTMVDIPACTDPASGRTYPATPHSQITNSLSHGGPGCTVWTWHELTGIHIDHYMVVDFAGVVRMADAVGGVPVCTTGNVYDPYSHLRLTAGEHVVKGVQALEWLRTRHGFGDGSDLYRTQTQHMYLVSLLRQLRSAGTLTDPGKLFGLADAATRALTVDDGLDSVGKLIGLAEELRGIDPERVTTVTMPYAADPVNPRAWVVPMPGDAERLFAMVRGDVPLDSVGRTAAGSSTAAPPSPAATVDPAAVRVTVRNGSGVSGRAAAVTLSLRRLGFAHARNGGNAAVRQRTTTLDYAPGERSGAAALAAALHLPATALRATASAGRPLLVIGADWPQGSVFLQPATPSAGAVPTTAARQSGAERKCAKVNPVYTW